jgi:hypothetical protein
MLLLVGGLAMSEAGAYSVKTDPSGSAVRWGAFPIEYDNAVGLEIPDAVTGVDDAFDAWAGVEETELVFARRDSQALPSGRPDRHNFVWVEQDWPFDEEQIAVTDLWTDQDGEIVAFDIHVNGRVSWSTDGRPDAFDVQAALVHEVGHALGLEHSEVASAAMFPSTARGAIARRALDQDDVDAVRWLYAQPEVAWAPVAPLPTTCATAGAPLGWAAPLVVAAALCGRRAAQR